ncbi:MAG: HIT domain-containing protein [Nocardioidaceae bacterium]
MILRVVALYRRLVTGWSEAWSERKRGIGCLMCSYGPVESDECGVRVFTGEFMDAYLWTPGTIRGYTVCIWKRGHVVEASHVDLDSAAGWWREVTMVSAAVERVFEPIKLNLETLGNVVPHPYTHVLPRYAGDPFPNDMLPRPYIEKGDKRNPSDLLSDAERVRSALAL